MTSDAIADQTSAGDAQEKVQLHVEFAGTASWLLMDLFWMTERIGLAMFAGFITLAAWIYVYRFLPRRLPEACANGAVIAWVVMNFLWMVGDEFELPNLKNGALAAVSVGFLLLGVAIGKDGLGGGVLRLFRRFRFRKVKSWPS